MNRALELAALGMGSVSPNPMVGSVIVHKDKIIGEGYHQKYGGGHAEVNAIASVQDHSLLSESTMYVTLEPCSHFGKTPPCADLLIQHKIKKVIIAVEDPNPEVAGKGIEKLRAAGIEVEVGLNRSEAFEINRRFFTYQSAKRPYVILKWAETCDGYMARDNYDSKWISDEHSRTIVHTWRAEEDAIMVGKNTAKYDNPQLTTRGIIGKNPIRIVLDRELELPENLGVFTDGCFTICYNTVKSESNGDLEYVKIEAEDFLLGVLIDLESRAILSVIVEGGARLLNSFIERNLWDEARVFVSPQSFGSGIQAPKLRRGYSEELLIADKLLTYRNK